jgi:hypothetical protein
MNCNKGVTKKAKFYKKDELLEYFGDKKEVVISHFCYGFVTMFVTISSPYESASFIYRNIVTNRTVKPDIELKVSIPACYDVTTQSFDQAEDVKKLYDFANLDSEKCFAWDDELNDFIKNKLGKQDPDAWLEKQIENNVLIEQKTGFLKFLVDFGGISQ